MSPTRKRILGAVAWTGLVALSLRPIGPVERAVELGLAPLAAAAELASPLRLLRAREARAARRELLARWEEEAARSEELLADLARAATPSPALRAGRRLVHADVVGRPRGNRDRLLVRLRDARGVAPGLPVVSGDAYVGRVEKVRPEPDPAAGGEAEVELVTARRFHVGARVVDEASGTPVDMTVGGLDLGSGRRSAARIALAVHNPSDRGLEGGEARVHERLVDVDPDAALADGYRLGRVRREGEERWVVDPELDYLDGLFHVVVLAPEDGLPSDLPMDVALADRGWLRARPLSHGDPSPWRETLKLAAGTARGVREGAAVAFGARLVGRVAGAGPWSADVSLLGDPGASVVAVARPAGDPVPRVLGRLVSLGREADGTVRLAWSGVATPPLDAAGAPPEGIAARLFTGSGDAGLPSGLYLGEARLPAGGDAAVVRLVAPRDAQVLPELWVRIEEEAAP